MGLFMDNPSGLLILAIAVAVVLLGVAIYELATHWSTVWGFIKGVVIDVWNWIKGNWPLPARHPARAAGVRARLGDPELGHHHHRLSGRAGSWIAARWNAVYGWIIAPHRLGLLRPSRVSSVPSPASSPLRWRGSPGRGVPSTTSSPRPSPARRVGYSARCGQIGGWFAGVAGSIAGAMAGVFNAIISPFQKAWDWISAHVLGPLKSGWNTIANAVNSIHFSVSIPGWVPVRRRQGVRLVPAARADPRPGRPAHRLGPGLRARGRGHLTGPGLGDAAQRACHRHRGGELQHRTRREIIPTGCLVGDPDAEDLDHGRVHTPGLAHPRGVEHAPRGRGRRGTTAPS